MSFKVGDVCITQHLRNETHLNGTQVVVIETKENWPARRVTTGELCVLPVAVRVRWPDGAISAQHPHELRLKRPPSDDTFLPASQEFTEDLMRTLRRGVKA